MATMLGYTKEELTGQSILDINPPEDHPRTLAAHAAFMGGARDLYVSERRPALGDHEQQVQGQSRDSESLSFTASAADDAGFGDLELAVETLAGLQHGGQCHIAMLDDTWRPLASGWAAAVSWHGCQRGSGAPCESQGEIPQKGSSETSIRRGGPRCRAGGAAMRGRTANITF